MHHCLGKISQEKTNLSFFPQEKTGIDGDTEEENFGVSDVTRQPTHTRAGRRTESAGNPLEFVFSSVCVVKMLLGCTDFEFQKLQPWPHIPLDTGLPTRPGARICIDHNLMLIPLFLP